MGANFHTDYANNTTTTKAESLNPALQALDKAITYLKNLIFSMDGGMAYVASTGVLSWDATLRILFIRDDGQTILNTIAAGSVTLADSEFAYVDLNETNNTALTVQKAAVSTGAASNFKAVNRLVLGYRNAASDKLFSQVLPLHYMTIT